MFILYKQLSKTQKVFFTNKLFNVFRLSPKHWFPENGVSAVGVCVIYGEVFHQNE